MPVTDDDIATVTDDVWSAMLGLPVRRSERAVVDHSSPAYLTGCVQITGAWEGAVTVDCSATLARQVAAVMFAAAPDEMGDEDIRDAIGELSNMTGGNLKNLVGGRCQLSLPSVTQGTAYTMTIPGSAITNQVHFVCDGQPLRVTVLERRHGPR